MNVIEALIVIAVFAYIAGVFAIRYFIGEKIFWGRRYLKQEYQILLSRRFDAYLFDTLAVCFLSPFALTLYFGGTSAVISVGTAGAIMGGLSALMFVCARLLVKICVFYNKQGLLLAKPFKHLRFVPWDEIGSIQKKNTSAQFYNVFGKSGHRLFGFPLGKKTQPFFEIAQQHGIDVCIPKGTKMVWDTSGNKLNGTLGEWDAVLDRSAYAQNDIIAFVLFQDFMVALFLDRRLNEDNVIAINRDGTVRWKISDIIKQSGPLSYAALTKANSHIINVMAVMSRQYDCTIYEIDVYEQKIIHQHSRRDI